jgi:hypothetical protein
MGHWLGTWELVPELSHYSAGGPPESGLYRIWRDGGLIRFQVDWVASGQARSVSFATPEDASDAPYPGLDRMFATVVSADVLDTTAFKDGQRIAYARRRVAAAGDLMAVFQDNAGPEGPVQIHQLYRRTR